jgi:hypothetical protein
MKEMLSRTKAVRFAVVVGASLTVLATTAAPAFAESAPSSSHAVPTLYCETCDNGPDAGGTDPGGRQDPGWGVSNHIGGGRDGGDRERPPARGATRHN